MINFPDFKSSIIDHHQYRDLEKRFFASNQALAKAEAEIAVLRKEFERSQDEVRRLRVALMKADSQASGTCDCRDAFGRHLPECPKFSGGADHG